MTTMMRLICSRRLKASPLRLRQVANYTFGSAVRAILPEDLRPQSLNDPFAVDAPFTYAMAMKASEVLSQGLGEYAVLDLQNFT